MDENIGHMYEMAELKKTVVLETAVACIKIIEQMPLHCAHTTFQVGIVNCTKEQAIDEIKKTFGVTDNELATKKT